MATTNSFIKHLQLECVLLLTLFIYIIMADSCPQQCICHGNQNLTANCSSLNLTNPPSTLSESTLTLNLSRNALGPIIKANFVSMRNLTMLDLSYNGLTRLLGCTFSGMLALKTIHLRGNGLPSLPDSLFADINLVENLDLSYNKLTEIPNEVLRNLPELRTLDVSHNSIGRLKLGERFKVPRQIQTIDFSYNLIDSIQRDSFEPSTEWSHVSPRAINLAFCRISSVEGEAFTSIPNLNNLDLSGNSLSIESLTTIVKDLQTKGIERLSLALMGLTSIDSLFREISELSLKFLNVSSNSISDLPQNAFTNIKSLQELDISSNRFSTLTEGFSDLINLKVLNISHNTLDSFQGDTVQNLSSLKTLDLSHNKLRDPTVVRLSPFINLNVLDVSSNILTSAVLPSSTSNLEYLNYRANNITIVNSIEDATKLTFVDFSDNKIQDLPGLLFKGARFLKLVNFSRNHIANLDHGAFLPQSSIVIDLSFNFLKEIRYSNWVATQKLYFNHNEIAKIDSQSFYGMTGLEELDLSSNRLRSLHEDLFQYLTMLKQLNVSHNVLDNVQWFSLFRSLELLKVLDLSHNNITHLNESLFLPLPQIKTVSFSHNLLRNINPNTFMSLIDIQSVDLSNNPFDCSCDSLSFRDWIKGTDLNILGLYDVNSSAYLCHTPQKREGLHVIQWTTAEFECDKSMLYIIIFCSTFALLTIFTLIGVTVYRRCVKRGIHQRRIRKELELEEERRRRAKKAEMVRLFEKTLELENGRGKGRDICSNSEVAERRNGYISWPGDVRGYYGRGRGRRVKGDDGGRLMEEERNERGEGKNKGGRSYERLKNEERVDEEPGRRRGREPDERSRREAVSLSGTGSRRDVSSHRQSESMAVVHSERHGGSPRIVSSRYEDSRPKREHERATYPDYNGGPYIISSGQPYLNHYDGKHSRDNHQDWINQRYRKSGGEGHRVDIYKTVPIGEGEQGRVEIGGIMRDDYPGHEFNHPVDVHYNSAPKRPIIRESHPRSFHQRSQSYNNLPQDYYGATPFIKEAGPRVLDNRRYTRSQVVIGHRAASQPYLNEATSGWL